MRKGDFDLEDLSDQLKQMQKLGGMSSMLGMLPGIGKIKKQIDAANLDDRILKRQRAIISSMTPKERRNPKILDGKPEAAHRGRLRHQARGHQQAAQDAPPDGGHDEDDGQARRGMMQRMMGGGGRGAAAEPGRDGAHAGGAGQLDPQGARAAAEGAEGAAAEGPARGRRRPA